ncbi:MAG: deoxyguanosinetriphosphate triphosphohydrolase [Oscillospiraceae bacterium]|jgi:dGTPase|nr:deoxyguanosinetriphosphate triphosphohydrolase [Oscillospiraceae bacterium]
MEENEFAALSPYAKKARESKGRQRPETPCEFRTDFQRDRDRVLHCKAFRRLMHKTQVFLSPEGDHYTTRMTHSLEVSQIARTMARILNLNEDLTEAIALAHDLGHTPFGHSGEKALSQSAGFPFLHSLQGARLVRRLERGGQGLNLTHEVVDGIIYHTTGGKRPISGGAETLEGRLVRCADKIAYVNHDAEDAIRAGILREDELPKEILQGLGRTKSQRITKLISSITENSADDVRFDPETEDLLWLFRDFMFETVYTSPVVKAEEDKAEELVKALYKYYVRHPDRLPDEYGKIREEEGLPRAVCDHISGMTDRFATSVYSEIFLPKSWQMNFGEFL